MVLRKSSNKGVMIIDVVTYFWKISLLTVVFFAFYFLVKSLVATDFDTSAVEAELFYYQTLYAKKGISYYDEMIDKVYPGVIDLARVKDKEKIESGLMDAINYGDTSPRLAAEYRLIDRNGKELATWYYDEKEYHNIRPVTFGKGAGAAVEVTHSLYVLILEDGKRRPGTLETSIVKQNS